MTYYGTAASESWPAPFCRCPACRKARQLGGPNIRTRSQALVDDSLLIDFPPDTNDHVLRCGLDLEPVTDLLITHSHPDHFYPADLCLRAEPYALGLEDTVLDVWGNARVHAFFRMEAANTPNISRNVHFHEIEPFASFQTRGGHTVTSLATDHMSTEQALNYLIEKDGRRILYAHDTGIYPEETWQHLKGMELHLISLDCTAVTRDWRKGHLGLPGVQIVCARLREIGCLTDDTKVVLNHLAHTEGLCHEDIVHLAQPLGMTVSYDGLCIDAV